MRSTAFDDRSFFDESDPRIAGSDCRVASLRSGAGAACFTDAAGAEEPVVSRILSMMSDFLRRELALTPSALAISSRVSLSLDSKTDCSSAAAATLFLSIASAHAGGYTKVIRSQWRR